MSAALLDRGRRGGCVVRRDDDYALTRVLEHRNTRVPRASGDRAGDPGVGAVSESDLPRPRDLAGGALVHGSRASHR